MSDWELIGITLCGYDISEETLGSLEGQLREVTPEREHNIKSKQSGLSQGQAAVVESIREGCHLHRARNSKHQIQRTQFSATHCHTNLICLISEACTLAKPP